MGVGGMEGCRMCCMASSKGERGVMGALGRWERPGCARGSYPLWGGPRKLMSTASVVGREQELDVEVYYLLYGTRAGVGEMMDGGKRWQGGR